MSSSSGTNEVSSYAAPTQPSAAASAWIDPNSSDLISHKPRQDRAALNISSESDESQTHVVPGTENTRQSEQSASLNKSDMDDDAEDDEDDSHKIVAESPDGRWQRRNETVAERDVPGIDEAYLAIDTEEGVEVVWNEMDICGADKDGPDSIKEIEMFFSNLIQLDHPNVVKFHSYWLDSCENPTKVFFITEHMSTGSLKQFLKKTKKTKQTLSRSSWKRWCIQILSALDYLHSCVPPIIHGVFTTDAIFIQNNGLVKIGSISPDLLQNHVRAVRDWSCSTESFVAPELANSLDRKLSISTAVDIYMFGLVALEMHNVELNGKGTDRFPDEESIKNAVASLEPCEQDFIRSCLQINPWARPTARQLLHHPAVFEFYSLRLLCAHALVGHQSGHQSGSHSNGHSDNSEKINYLAHLNAVDQANLTADKVLAVLYNKGKEVSSCSVRQGARQELCNLLEDVRNGHYPLTAYANSSTTIALRDINSPSSGSQADSATSGGARRSVSSIRPLDQTEPEYRRIAEIQTCKFEKLDPNRMQFSMQLNMLDVDNHEHMRRNLSATVNTTETPSDWTDELIRLGFINQLDRSVLISCIESALQAYLNPPPPTPTTTEPPCSSFAQTQSMPPTLSVAVETNNNGEQSAVDSSVAAVGTCVYSGAGGGGLSASSVAPSDPLHSERTAC